MAASPSVEPHHLPALKPPTPRLARRRCHRGFTLLEVLIAVAILAIMTLTVYQFTDTTLRAAAYSQKSGAEDAAYAGLRRLFAAQLASLPTGTQGALIGMTMTRGGGRHDVLQLVCPAGNALLTPDARGFYQVTFNVQETPRGSGHYALGMDREPWTDDDDDDSDDDQSKATALKATDTRPGHELARTNGEWIKLLDGIRSLEIAYYDARINNWVDKWTDPAVLPNLVRLRVTADGATAQPYEIVARVPGGGVRRVAPTLLQSLPGTTGTPGTSLNQPAPSYVPPTDRR